MADKNKLPDVFNVEQLIKIFDFIDRPKVAIACALAFFCGLRISEVCNLRIEHVDLERKVLKVVDGKNSRRKFSGYGKDRYVPIPPQLIHPLNIWIDIIGGGKWLFPSDKSPDTHLRKKSLNEQFRDVLKKAGLLIPVYTTEYNAKIQGKRVSRRRTRHKYYFHTLRHAYATYLRDKGLDIYDISALLGHSQVTTTQIYARISDKQLSSAVNKAFNMPLHQQVIPQEQIKRITSPKPNMSPMDYLQMQLIQGEITKEKYQEMSQLLQQEVIKRVV